MFVTSYSVTYCIYAPGKPGICFHYYCAIYDECKYSDMFWLAGRTRLFVQYTIALSSLCKLIGRHWTYEMPVRYILSSVWVRLSIFSPLFIIQYVGLYVFSLPIYLVMIEIIFILCLIIIIKSEVWTITHCLGLGHETMLSAVCLSILFFFWEKRSLYWHGAQEAKYRDHKPTELSGIKQETHWELDSPFIDEKNEGRQVDLLWNTQNSTPAWVLWTQCPLTQIIIQIHWAVQDQGEKLYRSSQWWKGISGQNRAAMLISNITELLKRLIGNYTDTK